MISEMAILFVLEATINVKRILVNDVDVLYYANFLIIIHSTVPY